MRVLIDGRWVIVRMYLSKEITKVEATAAVKREATAAVKREAAAAVKREAAAAVKREAAAIVADVKSGKLAPK